MTRPRRKRAARKTGDGIRAWLFLRHVEAYLAAWRAHGVLPGPEPGSEPGPFPIRIQTAADLEADRFDLLAWADPDAADGPASPFWIQSGMAEAVVDPKAEPLLAQVAADGGAVEGLRLAGGDLVLKIECAGTVVQIRVRGSAPFPEDGGIDIRHRFAMRMPPKMGRMVDFWSLAGLPAPRTGRGRRLARSRAAPWAGRVMAAPAGCAGGCAGAAGWRISRDTAQGEHAAAGRAEDIALRSVPVRYWGMPDSRIGRR